MRHSNRYVFFKKLILIFFYWFSTLSLVSSLYEDQIGKFDWRQQFVGRLDKVLRSPDIWQDHQSLIITTKSGSVSSLHLRNGSIHWRHIVESSRLDYLSSWPLKTTSTSVSKKNKFQCPVLSVNGMGRWIRCWATSGILVNEYYLPNDFLNEIESDPKNYQIYFELVPDRESATFSIVKITLSNYLIEFFEFQLESESGQQLSQLKPISKINANKWLDNSLCQLITWQDLVCIDQKDREFQVFSLRDQGRQIKRVSLSSFGLKSDSVSPNGLAQFDLNALPRLAPLDKTTTISKQSPVMTNQYFTLNLGNNEGIVLFKLNTESDIAGTIELVKIFPQAVQLTLIPLISSQEPSVSDSSNDQILEFGVAVLFTKKESIPYEDPTDAQHQKKVFAIKLAIFHIESWAEVTSISSKSILFELGSKVSVPPLTTTAKLPKRLDEEWSIQRFEIIPIRSLIFNTRTGRNQYRYTYKMLFSTRDGTLIVSNLMGKINWAREEALAEIVDVVLLDLPLSETDASLEQEYKFDRNANILLMFINRINSQLTQLTAFVRHLQNKLTNSLYRTNQKRNEKTLKQIDQDLNPTASDSNDDPSIFDENNEDEEELLVRDYFGLHKVIVARTRVGKLFALDSLSGRIIWSRYEPSLKLTGYNVKFPIWIQRTTAHYPYSSICTFLTESIRNEKNTFLYSFDPFTGSVLDSQWLPFKAIQAMIIQTIHDSEFRRPILLLDSEFKASLYPNNAETRKLFAKVAANNYMVIVNQTSTDVLGYNLARSTAQDGPELQLAWSFKLPHEPEKLVSIRAVFKKPLEHVHSQGRVLGDRNVLYKYLNPNLLAIVCESLDVQNKSLIALYLVDSITGNIVHSIVHRRARSLIQVVHSENWIIYSYYNDKMRRNEISSIELYEGFDQVNATAFSSIGRDLTAIPIVEQKSFIFPTGIGVMTDTETQKGITNKHILIYLPIGGLLDLPRSFLDPRRPIKPTPEHAEEGLIPYTPELPVPSEAMINYNQTILGVRGIVTAPATLESTSLVFAFGLDIYYTRTTPSKTFDILKDDFDHLLILAVLLLLIALSYLAKYMASRKSLNMAWK